MRTGRELNQILFLFLVFLALVLLKTSSEQGNAAIQSDLGRALPVFASGQN